MSDVHLPFQFLITDTNPIPSFPHCNNPSETPYNVQNNPGSSKPNKWDGSLVAEFLMNLDRAELSRIEHSLENSITTASKDKVDNICKEIQNTFDTVSKITFGIKQAYKLSDKNSFSLRKKRKQKKLPFFDNECRSKRSSFHRSRKQYNITKDKGDFEKNEIRWKGIQTRNKEII